MGLRSNIITISATVKAVQLDGETKANFIIESKDYKNQVLTIKGSVYGRNSVANLVEGARVIVIGTPVTQNGALFVNAYTVENPNTDFNMAMVSGYLGYDATARDLQGGKQVVSASIGCDTGTKQTSWFKVSTFRKLLDWMLPAMTKGAAMGFIGSLSQNSYTPQKGKNAGKEVTEYNLTANELFFFPKAQNQAGQSQGQSNGGKVTGYPVDEAPAPNASTAKAKAADSNFDEVPF